MLELVYKLNGIFSHYKGKSILLDFCQNSAREAGIFYLRGGGDALEKDSPFYAWKNIFLQIFGLHKMKRKSKEQKRQQVMNVIAPEWHMWGTISYEIQILFLVSVLNNLLDLDFPKQDKISALGTQEHRDITIEILVDILENVVKDHQKLLLIMDNCQV